MWPALAMYDFLLHAFRDKGTVPGPRRSGWRSDGAQIPQMRVRIGLQRCPQAASARELRHQKCIESGLGNSTAMRRDPAQLANAQFDVLIIGGGAFGAAAAREAALHGLRTAIIERSDFGSGASSECFKMVHGGIRYLQHADIRRLRLSCHERSTLLRIAPHLVRPLPIAIPTFGRGRRGRAFLGAGALLYDLLTFDRNDGIVDPTRRINRTRFLSRMEVLELHPHLSSPELSGAVVFEDGQMYNPARLVLAFVKAAVAEGAVACNYVEAQHYLWRGTHVVGVRALDRLTNETFDVRARLTLNAAGPWADLLNHTEPRLATARRGPFSRDAYFIVDRPPQSSYALALPGLSRDKDAVFSRSNRHLFTVPWRDKTLVGVWHRHWNDSPDAAQIDREELRSWIAELNTVHPALGMSIDEVTFANCGLVPFGETATQHELSFGKESRLIDHRFVHGVEGLVTLIGIRFTTARFDAARALGLLLEQWPEGRRRSRSDATTTIALPGGDITDFNAFRASCRKKLAGLPEPTIDGLVCNFGTEYRDVLSTLPDVRVDTSQLIGRSTLRHEVAYAVEHEMAVRLDDVVLRRTDLGAGVHPGRIALERAAEVMAQRLGWSSDRKRGEIELTERILAKHHARAAPSGQLQEAGYVTHQAVN